MNWFLVLMKIRTLLKNSWEEKTFFCDDLNYIMCKYILLIYVVLRVFVEFKTFTAGVDVTSLSEGRLDQIYHKLFHYWKSNNWHKVIYHQLSM